MKGGLLPVRRKHIQPQMNANERRWDRAKSPVPARFAAMRPIAWTVPTGTDRMYVHLRSSAVRFFCFPRFATAASAGSSSAVEFSCFPRRATAGAR
jgi:hypothetical protein